MKINHLKLLAVAAFVGLQSFSTVSLAGRLIEIDQGDNFNVSGQKWAFPGDFFKTSSVIGSGTITLPFALNIGAGAQTYSFQYDPFGRAVLLDASSNPTTNFIAPLFSATSPWRPDTDFGGFIAFGSGQIDPAILGPSPSPPYDITKAVNVYRFLWANVCSPVRGACRGDGTDEVSFEAVLIDRGGGDFDLDFFYKDPQGPTPADGLGGFLLGANTASFTSFTAPGPDFCFRAGKVGACSVVTAVPEPGSVMLFGAGLFALATLASLRRRTPTRRLAIS